MNRMIRGMAGLLVALGASACADDPSVEFGGDTPTKIQASPTVMFVNQGAREEILFRLVDDRNRSTPTAFEVSNVGAGITVELDDEYRPDYIGSDELEFNPIQHQHRYYVTANDPVGTQFTVSAGGISQVVEVKVVPTSLPLALAGGNGTTEPTAITNESFLFSMATVFEVNGIQVPLLSVSADGHTANVILPAGLTNAELTITGATASYMPTVALPALPADETVTTAASAGIPGTATLATAPTITIPAGTSSGFIDVGPYVGADDLGAGGATKWYILEVPADRGETDISVIWDAGEGSDIDVFLIDGAFTVFLGQAANSNNADHPPETITFTLTAGTYILAIVNFDDVANPPFTSVLFSDH